MVHARPATVLLATDDVDELVCMNGDLRVVIPYRVPGILANAVQAMAFEVVHDPRSSPALDVTVEAFLFESTRNALVCPLMHPCHPRPFLVVAIDKAVRDVTFSAADFLLIKFLFSFLTVVIETIYPTLMLLTEDDQSSIFAGVATVGSETTSHSIITKACEVGDSLTKGTWARLFSFTQDFIYEETIGAQIQNRPVPVMPGLIGYTATNNIVMSYVLPRRESLFNVQIDDIPEPRLWAMITSAIPYQGQVRLMLSTYNRAAHTFFSMKDRSIARIFSNSIGTMLFQMFTTEQLQYSISTRNKNVQNTEKLLTGLFHIVNSIGSPDFMDVLRGQVHSFAPNVELEIYVVDGKNLIRFSDGTIVEPSVSHRHVVTEKKTYAMTVGNRAWITFLVPLQRVFIFEYSAEMTFLHEKEGVVDLVQRRRVLPFLSFDEENALDEDTGILRISKDQLVAENPLITLPFVRWSISAKLDTTPMPTFLYDLSEKSLGKGKALILVDAGNQKPEERFIFPFDPFLISLLKGFSNFVGAQCLVRLQEETLATAIRRIRPFGCFVNCVTRQVPVQLPLSILLDILVQKLGPDTRVSVHYPPIQSDAENSETQFVIKKEQATHIVITIPSRLTPSHLVLLETFSVFYLQYIGSVTRIGRMITKESPPVTPTATFRVDEHTPAQNAAIAAALFEQCGICSLLNCSRERLHEWVNFRASWAGKRFYQMVNSLYFAYLIVSVVGRWREAFSPHAVAALAFSAFLENSPFSPVLQFKYREAFVRAVPPGLRLSVVAKVTAVVAQIGDSECDLFESATADATAELFRELLVTCPMGGTLRNVALFHGIRRNINFDDRDRALIVRQFVLDAACLSHFFVERPAFRTCLGDSPNLAKLRVAGAAVATLIGKELAQLHVQFIKIPEIVAANLASLIQKKGSGLLHAPR
jgi:hypothetical protein